jgi:hypothetical protein
MKRIIKKYTNATSYKIGNRRVTVVSRKDEKDDFIIEFRTIDANTSPRSLHKVIHGKLIITSIIVSKEAAEALRQCLTYELTRK